MLGSPQVSRTPSILMECTSFQRLYMGLSKQRELGMLGLRHFLLKHVYVMRSVDKTIFNLKHGNDLRTLFNRELRGVCYTQSCDPPRDLDIT
jgi:hypothetical protein